MMELLRIVQMTWKSYQNTVHSFTIYMIYRVSEMLGNES